MISPEAKMLAEDIKGRIENGVFVSPQYVNGMISSLGGVPFLIDVNAVDRTTLYMLALIVSAA